MLCPFCGHLNTAVKDSRAIEGDSAIKRRRHCPECGGRFTTVEHLQLLPLKVLKKSGQSEPFQRQKLYRALQIALHKRPIEESRLDKIVNSLIRQLETLGESEISSEVIGQIAMEALSDLDQVAYIRFASVYKNFDQPDDFKEFINTLFSNKK